MATRPVVYNSEELPPPIQLTNQMKNITEQKFGRLTALYPCGKNSSGETRWVCKCDCGDNYVVALPSKLKRGANVSCGSTEDNKFIQRRNQEKLRTELNGQIFNNLKVIDFDYIKGKRIYLKCQCLCCGTICSIRKDSIINGHTTSCGCIRSKGEVTIKNFLNKKNILYNTEYTFPDLLSNKNARFRFDFALFQKDELKCLIEYHGRQHYFYDGGWNTLEHLQKTQKNDRIKEKYCINNNIKLYIIKYNEDINRRMEEIIDELFIR